MTSSSFQNVPLTWWLLRVFNAAVFLISLALLIESACFTHRPGPWSYYSPFATLVVACCLCFQCLEVERLAWIGSVQRSSSWRCGIRYTYFSLVTVAIFVAGVGFSTTPKPDTAGLAILAAADGIAGITLQALYQTRPTSSARGDPFRGSPSSVKLANDGGRDPSGALRVADDGNPEPNGALKQRSKRRRCCLGTLNWTNRFLMVIHVCISILIASGGVQLALVYRYQNPGTRIQVHIPSGKASNTHTMNYYCAIANSSNSANSSDANQPTIWFEADGAHGTVDFLGVQTILRDVHGRNSCSYDPPNFGWSARLTSSVPNYLSISEYFTPLLEATGRLQEQKVLVGWGDGLNFALMHAKEHPDTTVALVSMDASPDAIQYLWTQRQDNWTMAQMLAYRESDLQASSLIAQAILGIGITWGLVKLVIPSNSTGYFNPSLYPRYTAQGRKEDFWAYQYYALLQMAASPINSYLTDTSAPENVEVKAIMTYGGQGGNHAEAEFYRQEKLKMMNNIAGTDIADSVIWCRASNCSLGFPVDIPWWTAGALVDLGI